MRGHVRPSSIVITAPHCAHRCRCMISSLTTVSSNNTLHGCISRLGVTVGTAPSRSRSVARVHDVYLPCNCLHGRHVSPESACRQCLVLLLVALAFAHHVNTGACNRQLRAISREKEIQGKLIFPMMLTFGALESGSRIIYRRLRVKALQLCI